MQIFYNGIQLEKTLLTDGRTRLHNGDITNNVIQTHNQPQAQELQNNISTYIVVAQCHTHVTHIPTHVRYLTNILNTTTCI